MTAPREEVGRLVERLYPGAAVERLAGDASYRIFYRVRPSAGPPVVVMDLGEPFEGEPDDVRLGGVFRRAGLRVADLIEVSPECGCVVLEDLGDRSLERELAGSGGRSGAEPPAALVRAVELAALIASAGTPALAATLGEGGPALDAERFRFEMDFFLEHFVRGLCGLGPESADLRGPLHELAERAAATPHRVLCHRDFHARNLMVLPDGALAMVDIQDARWGPDTYDLASILRDAYLEIDDAWLEPLIASYVAAVGSAPDAGFRRRFDLVAAERMIKALGSFGYLTHVKKLERYRDAVPRTRSRLAALLPSLPETGELHRRLERTGLLSD